MSGGKCSQTALPSRDTVARGGDDPQLRAVLELNNIVPAAAEKDLPRYRSRQHIFRLLRRADGNPDVVRTDRDRGVGAGVELAADAAQRAAGKGDAGPVLRLALDHIARADETGDEFRARPVVDILGAARLLDLAAVHHRNQVGGSHRLRLVMGDVDRGVAIGVVQPAHLEAHLLAQIGVEIG